MTTSSGANVVACLDACPAGWKQFEDNCYKYFLLKGTTFESAEQNCRNFGGHLMSIHSKREEDFLQDYGNRDYPGSFTVYLGAKNRGTIKDYDWIDGTPFDYTNYEVYGASGAPGGYLTQPSGDGKYLHLFLKASGRGGNGNGNYYNLFEPGGAWNDFTWDNPWNAYYGCKVCLVPGAEILSADSTAANKRLASATLYRAYSQTLLNHWYTTNWQEMAAKIISGQYNMNEANVGSVVPTGVIAPQCPHLVPLYHLYDEKKTDHIWTTNAEERKNLLGGGAWKDLGITAQCIADAPGECGAAKALHRTYVPHRTAHFYTTDATEYKNIIAGGKYLDEKVACYIWP